MNDQNFEDYGMTELSTAELTEINGGGLWWIAAGAAAVGAAVVGLYLVGLFTSK